MKTFSECLKAEKTNRPIICIGIDTGVHTGVAVWRTDEKKLTYLACLPIHEAMSFVKDIAKGNKKVFIRVEDARMRSWFGMSGREKLQGAGSVKRDAQIWEDFLTDLDVNFEMVAPKNNVTKLTMAQFRKITGITQKTNEHSRDAAMLVYGL